LLLDGKATAQTQGSHLLSSAFENQNTFVEVPSEKLKAHAGGILSLVVGESILISAAADNKIKLWSLPEGKLLTTLESNLDTKLAVSPNGKILVSGRAGSRLRLWSLPAGKFLSLLDVEANASLLIGSNNQLISSFASITAFAPKSILTEGLPAGLAVCGTPFTACHSGNLSPQRLKEPRRLFFHSFQFAVRHFALQFIPNRKSRFQIGVAQERFRLLRRQGAIRYEGFNQTAQDNREGRKLAFNFRFADGKQVELLHVRSSPCAGVPLWAHSHQRRS
jgi:hypothetical protein